MKYVLAVILAVVGIKFLLNEPMIWEVAQQNKELLGAVVLTILAKPLLKRIFE
ncbi:hypothetical protein [Kangiella spongicola]|jgi:predicted tellurium resistance membrane protein TerC|uniref:hypothetical protein n=1 Tax=Kangiella spongicola TaxID=796379 RepID=UPI0014756AD7|nr:hypothetical protein [Kangiella spongicola]